MEIDTILNKSLEIVQKVKDFVPIAELKEKLIKEKNGNNEQQDN
jgi:hypothetical protein